MSLQIYDITLAASTSANMRIASQGRYFYYLTGSTPNIVAGTVLKSAGNQALKIRPVGSGGEVVIMPGQSYRVPANEGQPTEWIVSNKAGLEVITGTLLVGEGEFNDSNTTNEMTLDATFANEVLVMNTAAERIPVNLDVTQLLRLDPAYPLTIAGNTVQYTNAFADNSVAAQTATVIFTAATNANGAYIEYAEFSINNESSNGYMGALIAKATAPASNIDGDVVMTAGCVGDGGGTVPAQTNFTLPIRVKIPAGKGLYLNQTANAAQALKTVLYTLL